MEKLASFICRFTLSGVRMNFFVPPCLFVPSCLCVRHKMPAPIGKKCKLLSAFMKDAEKLFKLRHLSLPSLHFYFCRGDAKFLFPGTSAPPRLCER